MATTESGESDASYKYVEQLQLHAGKIKEILVWDELQSGPPHDMVFTTNAKIGERIFPQAQGKTKKKAKQNAAKIACEELGLQNSRSDLSFHSTSRTPSPANTENYISKLNEYRQKKNVHVKYFFDQIKTGMDHVQRFRGRYFNNNIFGAKRVAAKRTYEEIQEQQPPFKIKSYSDMSWASGNMSNSSSQDGIIFKDSSTPGDTPNPTSSEPSTSSMDNGPDKKRGMMSFDNFTDKEIIGEGGFGCVYKAKYTLDENYYAVKEVLFQNDRARREVTSLAKLEHPNIVRYHTCWTEERDNKKYLYIQMKLYEMNMKNWIKDRKNYQSQKKVNSLDIMRQLLDGVDYIHQHNLFHRDLKPANVFLTEETKLEAKIGDFGLAKVKNQRPLTMNVGTRLYMSPEQFAKQDYNHKVDIFALGLIFFELLWMYKGTVLEIIHIWDAVRKGTFRETFVKEYPNESALIQKMLSEDPKERPEAAEVRRELDALRVQTNEEDKEGDKEEDPPQIPISDQQPN